MQLSRRYVFRALPHFTSYHVRRFPTYQPFRHFSTGIDSKTGMTQSKEEEMSNKNMSEAPKMPGNKGEIYDAHEHTVHFKHTSKKHPLMPKVENTILNEDGTYMTTRGEQWMNPMVNHIWTKDEIKKIIKDQPHHKPRWFEWLPYWAVRTLYHGFNKITGYNAENPPVKAVEWRLLILESFAGVPGFVAAGCRHFRSLRSMERDNGWIHTLLEEAENERMHLLTCMKMFDAGIVTRLAVMSMQLFAVPVFTLFYLLTPKLAHRFVGYLEETAVHTYTDILYQMDREGSHLNKAWSRLPAPQIAKAYWKLPVDASWRDTLEQILSDESHHRDVNHTFASIKKSDVNPYIKTHLNDSRQIWRELDNTRDGAYMGVDRGHEVAEHMK